MLVAVVVESEVVDGIMLDAPEVVAVRHEGSSPGRTLNSNDVKTCFVSGTAATTVYIPVSSSTGLHE